MKTKKDNLLQDTLGRLHKLGFTDILLASSASLIGSGTPQPAMHNRVTANSSNGMQTPMPKLPHMSK